MTEANINGWVLFRESLGKLFCTINRTVLSPSAPKVNLKMSEVTFKVFVDRLLCSFCIEYSVQDLEVRGSQK